MLYPALQQFYLNEHILGEWWLTPISQWQGRVSVRRLASIRGTTTPLFMFYCTTYPQVDLVRDGDLVLNSGIISRDAECEKDRNLKSKVKSGTRAPEPQSPKEAEAE